MATSASTEMTSNIAISLSSSLIRLLSMKGIELSEQPIVPLAKNVATRQTNKKARLNTVRLQNHTMKI